MSNSTQKILGTSLPITLCLGWGIGSAGMAAMNLSRALLLRFMVDYLEIAAVTAGLMFGLSKLFDAATDPAMGWISDRTTGRYGRRSPYLLAGAFLCGISYVLLFNVPDFSSNQMLLLYVEGVLFIFAIAYTLFSVPYLSMPVDIAPHYHQRSFLLSFRAGGIALGGLIGGVLGPTIITLSGSSRESHEIMSVYVGAAITVSMFIAFWSTRRLDTLPKTERVSMRFVEKLKTVANNSNFLILFISKFCFFTGIAMLNATGAFFTRHVLQAPDTTIAVFFLCFFVAVILVQPLWLKLGKKFAKHNMFVMFAVFVATINLSWLFAASNEPILFVVIRSLLIGAGFGGVLLMGQAMLPDTIEYDRNKTGLSREGVYAGIFSIAEKSSTALGVALVGIVMGTMGYIEGSASASVIQPDSAINSIYLCFSIIPAVLITIGALVMRFYGLTESALEDSRVILPTPTMQNTS